MTKSQGFDSGVLTGMVFVDLQKGFDTIDHNILILKMPSLGFTDETIKCYTSYPSRQLHVQS